MPTVQTFAVRETSVSRTANVGMVGKNWLQKRNVGQKWVNLSYLYMPNETTRLRNWLTLFYIYLHYY